MKALLHGLLPAASGHSGVAGIVNPRFTLPDSSGNTFESHEWCGSRRIVRDLKNMDFKEN